MMSETARCELSGEIMFMRRTDLQSSLLLIVLFFFFASLSSAQVTRTNRVAVLDFELSGGIPSEYSLTFSDIFRQQLHQTGRFSVIERQRMEEILKEQGFQLSGCTSSECAVEVGQLLGVDEMVAGSIGKVGEMYFVIVRLIDVETAEIIDTRNVPCKCSIEDVATTAIPRAAYELAGASPEEQVPQQEIVPSAGRRGLKKDTAGYHRHEKFYFQFGLGPGSTKSTSSLLEIKSNGAAMALDMQFGWVFSKKYVVYFAVVGHLMSNPNVVFLKETIPTDSLDVTINGYGIGFKYYIPAKNLFVDLALLQTTLTLDYGSGRATGETNRGGGIQLGFGKEWWISHSWSLGVEAYYHASSAPDKPPFDNVTWSNESVGVMFTAVFD